VHGEQRPHGGAAAGELLVEEPERHHIHRQASVLGRHHGAQIAARRNGLDDLRRQALLAVVPVGILLETRPYELAKRESRPLLHFRDKHR